MYLSHYFTDQNRNFGGGGGMESLKHTTMRKTHYTHYNRFKKLNKLRTVTMHMYIHTCASNDLVALNHSAS